MALYNEKEQFIPGNIYGGCRSRSKSSASEEWYVVLKE